MSENELNQDGADQAADQDLNDALSSGEESFATGGEEKPQSKKPVVVLGVVLAAIVAYFGYSKFMPKGASASAVPPPSAETLEADKTITTFLNAGGESIKTMQELLKNTSRIVQQFKSYPLFTQVPLNDL